MSRGWRSLFDCSMSAATPAICGAAADVPRKLGLPSPSVSSPRSNSVFTLSGAMISGLSGVVGVASLLP